MGGRGGMARPGNELLRQLEAVVSTVALGMSWAQLVPQAPLWHRDPWQWTLVRVAAKKHMRQKGLFIDLGVRALVVGAS